MTAPSAPTEPATLPWWRAGETFLATTADGLSDADLDGPSLLEGWTRRTLLAHVAGNAEALVNLVTWATTGVETPMYASPEARREGIEQIAALPDRQLRARLGSSTSALSAAIEHAPVTAWQVQIRTALGRQVAAAQVPWMRCREVWVHAVDLNAGADFAHIPEEVQVALVDDVVTTWTGRDDMPDVTVRVGDRTWGTGSVPIEGGLVDVLATLTGRGADLNPRGVTLPRWL